ncbi:helix-turn-helix domain-containing protein [Caldibacillus lycopersici]|uniref:Helix-turn-helix domain-containing protein n=1 Tax=Perspicuibacillus lycopersici TaxID=1325689 RepID=A0AAE3IVC2_9BACI|nr:helix-turn-helix transcriptional regulator [Perspicuibacillus lycopersici]MCU9615263.1 helix-turn-helix domain-containing protein [Perspicuibacillus lycopersici]
MESEKWGRRIRAFRKLKGFTQKELADELGISVSVLGEVERGTRLPSNALVSDISKILSITIDDLKPPEEENSSS